MQKPSPKCKDKGELKEGKPWEINFRGLVWVTLLEKLTSHLLECKPYLLWITLS